MQFKVFGPFELPRLRASIIDTSSAAKAKLIEAFEESAPGLSGAHGCYVFVLKSGRGALPWYVGKAERSSFAREVFTPTKLLHYQNALHDRARSRPMLYLIVRMTPDGRFGKPGENEPVAFLENMLIGLAVARNPALRNKSSTKLLRAVRVLGLFNSTYNSGGKSAASLRSALDV